MISFTVYPFPLATFHGSNTCITPFRQLNEGLGAIFRVYVIPNSRYISEINLFPS